MEYSFYSFVFHVFLKILKEGNEDVVARVDFFRKIGNLNNNWVG